MADNKIDFTGPLWNGKIESDATYYAGGVIGHYSIHQPEVTVTKRWDDSYNLFIVYVQVEGFPKRAMTFTSMYLDHMNLPVGITPEEQCIKLAMREYEAILHDEVVTKAVQSLYWNEDFMCKVKDDSPPTSPHAFTKMQSELVKVFPVLNYIRKCPEADYCPPGQVRLQIQHLNDNHKWSREDIAKWVDSLEQDHIY